MRLIQRFAFPVIIAVSIFISSSAYAKFVPQVGIESSKGGTAYVTVNGHKAVHLKTSNGNLSPSERAAIAAGRLTALVSKGLDIKAITYKTVAPNTRVMVGDQMLIVATAGEAKAHNVSSEQLAKMWVDNLRKLLSLPPLSASPSSLTVPLGESRSIVVESLLTKPAQYEVSNPAIVKIDPKVKPGSLAVTGLSTGDVLITIRCDEYIVPVTVSVKKYAASLPSSTVKATVTGWNVPVSIIARTARAAARCAVSLEPGAKITSIDAPPVAAQLAPSQLIRIPVQVRVGGADYIPTQFSVSVEVENRKLPEVPTSWLMYSNNPERVLKYQVLFTGRLSSTQESTRLLYHHQNMMQKAIGFVIDVVNPSASPASFHLVEGVSEPMVDTVIVGYKAGLEFLQRQQSRVGRVVEVPAGTRQVIVSQPLGSPHTASGIIELRQISGDPLYVRVIAKPESQRQDEDSMDLVIPASGIGASKVALSDEIYPNPLKNIEARYTVGKPWVFLRIGKNAIKHATNDKVLYGNYGVTYDIKVALENPSSDSHTVELAFEATAGPASAIFLVDGNMVTLKMVKSLQEITVGRITIPPGKTRDVSIKTMPLSGSAYPATLIIRPAGTTAAMR